MFGFLTRRRIQVFPIQSGWCFFGGGRDGLKDIPMLDDLTFAVEAKDVNASSFLAGPIQITHVYEGKIPLDGNTFHLAGNAAGLLDVGHDPVEPIGEKRIVLNVRPGHQTRKQISSALIKNLVVYNVQRVLDMLSCHKSSFGISVSGNLECSSNLRQELSSG